MRKHNVGDIVLCKKFSIEMKIHFRLDQPGCETEPYIDTRWFNRKAKIVKTYKEYMDNFFGVDNFEDRDEYEIQFLDDGVTLSWVKGDDLIPMNYFDSL